MGSFESESATSTGFDSRRGYNLCTFGGSPPSLNRVRLDSLQSVLFVAFSHVRSQTLIDPSTPTDSQIRNLQDQANSLFPSSAAPILFWIDTLCSPPEEGNNFPNLAIKRVFQVASAVLVIDRNLLEARPITQLSCREAIRSSAWIKRLWTIQEGAVAKLLVFRFSDRIWHAHEILPDRVEDSSRLIQEVVANDQSSVTEDQLKENHLRHLEILEKDLTAAPKAGIIVTKRQKMLFRSLLRFGYLSVPWFRAIVSEEEHNEALRMMAGISAIYAAHPDIDAKNLLQRLDNLSALIDERHDTTAVDA